MENLPRYSNITLFPHDGSIVIKDIVQKREYLGFMKNILAILLESIEHFECFRLSQFDAQVGETLCQIRAYKIQVLSLNYKKTFHTEIKSIKESISTALINLKNKIIEYDALLQIKKGSRPKETSLPISLDGFFSSFGCYFELHEDILFLFLSYFLCLHHVMDEDNIPVSINYQQVKDYLGISQSYTKKIIHFYQKLLSKLSCKFVFELLSDLPGKDDLKTVLPYFYLKSDEGRMALPCRAVTEIIIDHILLNNRTIVLVCNYMNDENKETLAILFQGVSQNNTFIPIDPKTISSKEACFILYGTSSSSFHSKINVSTKIINLGLRETVLLNNSAHPQYSGKTLFHMRTNPYEHHMGNAHFFPKIETSLKTLSDDLNQNIAQAHKDGCSLQNYSTFLLKHIFCNTIENYIDIFEPTLYRDNQVMHIEEDIPPKYA